MKVLQIIDTNCPNEEKIDEMKKALNNMGLFSA
jgi:hypothetical protein